jgi:Mg2+/citrate symporter
MNRQKLSYFLLIASSILLLVGICKLDFNNLQKGNYWRIITNLLLMIAMIFNIRNFNKSKEEK